MHSLICQKSNWKFSSSAKCVLVVSFPVPFRIFLRICERSIIFVKIPYSKKTMVHRYNLRGCQYRVVSVHIVFSLSFETRLSKIRAPPKKRNAASRIIFSDVYHLIYRRLGEGVLCYGTAFNAPSYSFAGPPLLRQKRVGSLSTYCSAHRWDNALSWL